MCVFCALATPCDCSREPSEWDKLFIMLEDSQMREGMLLQATDQLLRGELQRLRAELERLAGHLSQRCTPADPAETGLADTLAKLLQASRDAGRRLARLEGAGEQRAEPAGGALGAVLTELRRTRADLRALQLPVARRRLPAGKHSPPRCAPEGTQAARGRPRALTLAHQLLWHQAQLRRPDAPHGARKTGGGNQPRSHAKLVLLGWS